MPSISHSTARRQRSGWVRAFVDSGGWSPNLGNPRPPRLHMDTLMLLVGLTGNIASGKSTVAHLLAARGATIIDADVLARQAVEEGTPAYREIVDRWGRSVLGPDGHLDRGALRRLVFQDQSELEALNR